MVGQKVHKTGTLDVKTPAKGFTRGWRPSPWKNRRVDLVEEEGQNITLLIYREGDEIEHSYILDDVNDVTMIASKTHAHAFEITANGSALVILSGSTELQSRDWIWALRRLFWPQAMVQLSQDDKMTVRLRQNEDLYRHNIRGGVYELDVSVTGVRMNFLSRDSAEDSRMTPVEPFIAEEPPSSFMLPLTTIGQYRLNYGHIEITTTPDSDLGVNTFVIEPAGGSGASIATIASVFKTAVFSATNCLHDAIAASYWNQDHVT